VVVAGIGSEYRHDDGVGPAIAAHVACGRDGVLDVGPIADPLDLLGRWDGAELAVVVDAVRSGSPAGTVHVVDVTATEDSPPHCDDRSQREMRGGITSTHGIGFAGVLRLARAVGNAPARVVVVGIEGCDFSPGTGLSAPVAQAAPVALRRVLDAIEEVLPCA
jgi:hydrogenase maturation protease